MNRYIILIDPMMVSMEDLINANIGIKAAIVRFRRPAWGQFTPLQVFTFSDIAAVPSTLISTDDFLDLDEYKIWLEEVEGK